MLTRSAHVHVRHPSRQKGLVLVVALIVLVALTLAGIALVRSVDTTNIIAGNMGFQQAAVHSGDTGIETAYAWLTANNNNTLYNDRSSNGYTSDGNAASNNPSAGQTWDAFWASSLASRAVTLPSDAAGNVVSYVIDRLCNFSGPPTGGASCNASPLVYSAASGNSDEANSKGMNANSLIYYRITSRIAGPRGTVGYVQAIVAL